MTPAILRTDVARAVESREHYLRAALAEIPRLLGTIDRNPYRDTFGSFDRQYWHYRTAAFPSEMYQEAVLPLALIYKHALPGNRWHRRPRLRALIVASLRFSARAAHADGSCDDYYPYERALGAAVFSLNAAAEACRLLQLDDPQITAALVQRARWIATHDESGTLTNHHALAALALERVARLTRLDELHSAAARKLQQVLAWQSTEGWFVEYGGADPGYQTVTIDCLAKLRAQTGNDALTEPLHRAVRFARQFIHPDGSYGGEYGSRGTYHFYPHGCELLAHELPEAAELAEGFLHGLSTGRQAAIADDRLYVHRLGNLLEAYLDWSPTCPEQTTAQTSTTHEATEPVYLPQAQLLVDRAPRRHTVVSAARGGVFKHYAAGELVMTDTGLVLETTAGRIAVSQQHDLTREIQHERFEPPHDTRGKITVAGPLHYVRFETATPFKQAVLHLGMIAVGRWCRTLVRRVLQRRLITGRKACPIRLERTIELLNGSPRLRVTDRIRLLDASIQVRRLSFSTDLEASYVAASGVYQDSVLQSWTPLDEYVERLNRYREVTVVRSW